MTVQEMFTEWFNNQLRISETPLPTHLDDQVVGLIHNAFCLGFAEGASKVLDRWIESGGDEHAVPNVVRSGGAVLPTRRDGSVSKTPEEGHGENLSSSL